MKLKFDEHGILIIHRLLEKGEKRQDGDEYFFEKERLWFLINMKAFYSDVMDTKFRRKIKYEAKI